MSELTRTSLAAGAAIVLCWLPALMMPAAAREWCRRFPRNAPAGWVLAAVDLAWSAWLLYEAPFLADIRWIKPALLVAAPVSFILVILLLDELLAARALGGLLLLLPRPVLDAAFVHHSPWRFAMTALAYVVAVAGIMLVLNPYWFRKLAEVLLKTDARSRLTGAAGVAVGAAAIALALAAY